MYLVLVHRLGSLLRNSVVRLTDNLDMIVLDCKTRNQTNKTRQEKTFYTKWAASREFVTDRLCEQRRFRRACTSAQSRQNLGCSLIQAVSQEEPSDRKPDPWPLWMAGHAQLQFVMTECSKTQIRLTRPKCKQLRGRSAFACAQSNQCLCFSMPR